MCLLNENKNYTKNQGKKLQSPLPPWAMIKEGVKLGWLYQPILVSQTAGNYHGYLNEYLPPHEICSSFEKKGLFPLLSTGLTKTITLKVIIDSTNSKLKYS